MKRVLRGLVAPLALLAAGIVWLPSRLAGQTTGTPSTKNGEWPMYTADLRGSKYSPLDQIAATNFNKLEVAWRFKTDNLGPRPENKLEGTPIMVGGMVYTTGGSRRAAVALDARTGELKWIYSMDEGLRAAAAPRQLSGRGLSYWTDGKGDDRIVLVTIGYRLVALNAKTGQPIPGFGKNGVVDLKEGVIIGKDTQIDLDRGEIGLHSTATVVNDTIIVGSSMAEGLGYRYSTNAKGLVRAFDAKTGKQIWRFNTIPYPGELGNDSWDKESWSWTGNNGVWTQITVDPEAGLVYLPVESPTIVARRGRSENRRAEVAFPTGAPSDLGSRHLVGAAPHRRGHRRPAAQARGAADETELHRWFLRRVRMRQRQAQYQSTNYRHHAPKESMVRTYHVVRTPEVY
jgi:glucose dehydrogenase